MRRFRPTLLKQLKQGLSLGADGDRSQLPRDISATFVFYERCPSHFNLVLLTELSHRT
jgi:hypothetical protein